MKPFVGSEPKNELQQRGVQGKAVCMLHRIDQTRRRQYLKTLVDADEEFRWNERALNDTELCAFDLPWNSTQLARWIDFCFDAATRIPLQCGGIVFCEEVAWIVYGWDRHLHDVG